MISKWNFCFIIFYSICIFKIRQKETYGRNIQAIDQRASSGFLYESSKQIHLSNKILLSNKICMYIYAREGEGKADVNY